MSDMVVLGMSISGVVIGVLLILWECRFKRWTKTERIITAVETTRLPIIMHVVDAFTADRIGLLDERYNVYLAYEYQVEGQRYSGKGLPNRQDRKLSPAELKKSWEKTSSRGKGSPYFLILAVPRHPCSTTRLLVGAW